MTCSNSSAEFVPGDLKHSNVFTLFCLDCNSGFLVCRTHHQCYPTKAEQDIPWPRGLSAHWGTHLHLAWGQKCHLLSFQHDSFWFCVLRNFLSVLVHSCDNCRWCPCGLQAARNILHRWNTEGWDTTGAECCVVWRTGGYLLSLRLICMFFNFPLLKNNCKAPPLLIFLSVLLLFWLDLNDMTLNSVNSIIREGNTLDNICAIQSQRLSIV